MREIDRLKNMVFKNNLELRTDPLTAQSKFEVEGTNLDIMRYALSLSPKEIYFNDKLFSPTIIRVFYQSPEDDSCSSILTGINIENAGTRWIVEEPYKVVEGRRAYNYQYLLANYNFLQDQVIHNHSKEVLNWLRLNLCPTDSMALFFTQKIFIPVELHNIAKKKINGIYYLENKESPLLYKEMEVFYPPEDSNLTYVLEDNLIKAKETATIINYEAK